MPFTAGMDLNAELLNAAFGVIARKTSDEGVNNSSTLQDDNDLQWALQASLVYTIDIYVAYNTNSTADIKFGWTVPASSTLRWSFVGVDTALALKASSSSILNGTSVEAFGGDGTERYVQIHGVISTSTTAASLVLRWAQNTANVSDTFVRNGSWGIVRRVI